MVQHNYKTTFSILILATAVIQLAGLSGCGDSPTKEVVLASVGDSTITEEMINVIFAQGVGEEPVLPSRELQIKRTILDNIAEKQLLALGGQDAGLHLRPEFAQRAEKTRHQIITNLYFDDNVAANSRPSDKELKEFREESAHEVKLAVIKLSAPFDTAVSVYDRLVGGEDLSKLAVNYSREYSSRSKGGVTGFVPISYYSPEIRAAIDSLAEQTYSKPFYSSGSLWIIKVLGHKTTEKQLDGEINLSKVAELKKLRLTLSLSELLWGKFNCAIRPPMIELYEGRIRDRGKPDGVTVDFDVSYFTEEEMESRFVDFDGGNMTLSEFLEAFADLEPPIHPVLGDKPSYERFVRRAVFEKLLYHEAESGGYLTDPRYLLQWRLVYMRSLADFAVGTIIREISITDDDLRAEYDNNTEKYMRPGQTAKEDWGAQVDPEPQGFDQVKRRIKAEMTAGARAGVRDEYLEKLRAKHKVKMNYDLLEEVVTSGRMKTTG